jgi:hypothetical protein
MTYNNIEQVRSWADSVAKIVHLVQTVDLEPSEGISFDYLKIRSLIHGEEEVLHLLGQFVAQQCVVNGSVKIPKPVVASFLELFLKIMGSTGLSYVTHILLDNTN